MRHRNFRAKVHPFETNKARKERDVELIETPRSGHTLAWTTPCVNVFIFNFLLRTTAETFASIHFLGSNSSFSSFRCRLVCQELSIPPTSPYNELPRDTKLYINNDYQQKLWGPAWYPIIPHNLPRLRSHRRSRLMQGEPRYWVHWPRRVWLFVLSGVMESSGPPTSSSCPDHPWVPPVDGGGVMCFRVGDWTFA